MAERELNLYRSRMSSKPEESKYDTEDIEESQGSTIKSKTLTEVEDDEE